MTRLVVRVRDTGGGAAAGRVSVRAVPDGRPAWPSGDHPRYDIVEPWGAEQSFVCDGEAVLEVPPGRYDVVVTRGPEFLDARASVTAARAEVSVEFGPRRVVDMAARGWYSGDVHIHRSPDELPLLLRAEGIRFGAAIDGHIDLLPGGDARTVDIAGASATGPGWGLGGEAPVVVPGNVEIERIGGGPGAILGLSPAHPLTIRAASWAPFDDTIARAVRSAGGHVDGEKVFWPSIPVLAALDVLDSVELACNHVGSGWTHLGVDEAGGFARPGGLSSPRDLLAWILELYYALLGCGFRVPASGGSGAGVMPNPVGASRVYVRLDASPNAGDRALGGASTWLGALRNGRSFSTNGPLLELDVAGHGPGETVREADGAVASVRIEAVAARPLAAIELLVDGAVVGSWTPREATEPDAMVVETEVGLSPGGWIAARAVEAETHPQAIRFAHTSPVWVAGSRQADPGSAEIVGRWLRWTERLAVAAKRSADEAPAAPDALRAIDRAKQVLFDRRMRGWTQ